MSTSSANIRLKRYHRGILYEARHLQELVEPGSSVHPGVNLEGDWNGEQHLEPLRDAVTKTRDLIVHLDDSEAFSDDFELAWNGIMPSRLQERKRQ